MQYRMLFTVFFLGGTELCGQKCGSYGSTTQIAPILRNNGSDWSTLSGSY